MTICHIIIVNSVFSYSNNMIENSKHHFMYVSKIIAREITPSTLGGKQLLQ